MNNIIAVVSSQPKSVYKSKNTFLSIKNQTLQPDKIFWFYPYFSKRFNIEYPDIPVWTKEIPNLEVIRTEDYGPATKIVPLLDMDIDKNTKIVIFDDDTEYPENNIELLNKYYKEDRGIGFMGSLFRYVPIYGLVNSQKAFSKNNESKLNIVNICLCSYMVMYPRYMYPDNSEEYLNDMGKIPELFLNDDLMNSYYAYKNNIDIYLINNEKETKHIEREGCLTGTNYPGRVYAKMLQKNMSRFPLINIVFILIMLIIIISIVYRLLKFKKFL